MVFPARSAGKVLGCFFANEISGFLGSASALGSNDPLPLDLTRFLRDFQHQNGFWGGGVFKNLGDGTDPLMGSHNHERNFNF